MAPKKRKADVVESSDDEVGDIAMDLADEEDEELHDGLMELDETEEVGDEDGDVDSAEVDFEEDTDFGVDECMKPIVSGTERTSKPKKIRLYQGSPLCSESDSDIV